MQFVLIFPFEQLCKYKIVYDYQSGLLKKLTKIKSNRKCIPYNERQFYLTDAIRDFLLILNVTAVR